MRLKGGRTMKRAIRWIAGTVVLTIWIGIATAQQPPEPLKPMPEHKALGYFAGKWTSQSAMKPGAYGPGGKMTSKDDCQWFEGGFQLVCHSQAQGPVGSMASMGIMTYNPNERVYSYYGIDNKGMSELSIGRKEGSKWTFMSTTQMGDQTMKSRYTIIEGTPTAYTFKWETSPDGAQWSTLMEGKSTKSGE
jgi:Protein of unknown function (DUF1579)